MAIVSFWGCTQNETATPIAPNDSINSDSHAETKNDPTGVSQATDQISPDDRVRCVLTLDEETYEGPCIFYPQAGGTFVVRHPSDDVFLNGFRAITVIVTEKGKGRAFGTPIGKPNERIGLVTRSTTDRACWEGDSYKICAY